MKKLQIVLALLLILLVAGGVFATLGVLDIKNRVEEPTEAKPIEGNQATHASYVDEYTQYAEIRLPLMRTEFENVFYTLNRNTGAVTFYEAENGVLTPVEESSHAPVTVTCSSQNLTADVHYLERDGHTFGVGLYTNNLYEGAYLYEYAFFKVSDLFPQSGAAEGSLLLTVDVDASRMYQERKVYSENYILSPDKTSAKYYLSEDQRTVDTNARMRTDYKMFTDDILAEEQAEGRTVLFFSSRYYEMYERAGKVDIFTSGGTGTNTDNGREVIDVYSLHLWRDGGDIFFLRRAEGGFTLNVKRGATGVEETLRPFTGDIDKDYIVDRDWIFNKTSGEVINVITNERKVIDLTRVAEGGVTADLFAISENGQYAVLRGLDPAKKSSCAFLNLTTGEMVSYTDEPFALIANLQALNDGTIVLSVADNMDPANAKYYQLAAKSK